MKTSRRVTPFAQNVMDNIFDQVSNCVTPLADRPCAYEELPPLGMFMSQHGFSLGGVGAVLKALTTEEIRVLQELYKERGYFRSGEPTAGARVGDSASLLHGLCPHLVIFLGPTKLGESRTAARFGLTPLGYICAYLCGDHTP